VITVLPIIQGFNIIQKYQKVGIFIEAYKSHQSQ
jgi:hypothetical protein